MCPSNKTVQATYNRKADERQVLPPWDYSWRQDICDCKTITSVT